MAASRNFVLCFGVFDGLHDGHRFFLRAARALGDRLIVAVARDGAAAALKGRAPLRVLEDRIAELRQENIADEVVSGDAENGSWEIVRRYRPAVVALGYDQEALRADLERHIAEPERPRIVVVGSYRPEEYKSSIRHV